MQKLAVFFGWINGIGISLAIANHAGAEPIMSDGTLSTKVTSADHLNFTISNGNQVGNNLFHSFSQFSIPTGGSVIFNNLPNIENVISRVTGNSISQIDGLIRNNTNANLFLINPNGIIFGPNASLNINGSLIVSTANGIKFADGSEFKTTIVNPAPLLTMSIPIGLQYTSRGATIAVQGAKLAVNSGKSLILVGGAQTFQGANLSAPQGIIELGSIASAGLVSLNPTGTTWNLSYENIPDFGNIDIGQGTFINTSGNGGGSVQIQSRSLRLSGGSRITNFTLGTQAGGNITINAADTVEIDGTGTYPKDFLNFLSGTVTPTNISNGLLNLTFNSGAAGDININTANFLANNGAFVATSTLGAGKGGNITLNANNRFNLNSSALITGAINQGDAGNAGNIKIKAGSVQLNNYGKIAGRNIQIYGEFLQLNNNSLISAEAGNLNINTTTFVALQDSNISANNFLGMGGNIDINTQGYFVALDSGVNASSQLGISGAVKINTSFIDRNKAFTIIPKRAFNSEKLVVRDCVIGSKPNISKLILSGRGGLPLNPEGILTNDLVLTDLNPVPVQSESKSAQTSSPPQIQLSDHSLVEAQGWSINAEGKVILTTTPPNITLESSGFAPPGCQPL